MGGFLTPTKVAAWLQCEHVITLANQVESGELVVPEFGASPMAQLLMDKGVAQEREVLERYLESGRAVFDASTLRGNGDFDDWADACSGLLNENHDVIYQMPLRHGSMRGVADFVERVESAERTAPPLFEPVDAKLSRREAKTGHVLQLCFYADAIESLTGHQPARAHIELGSGRRESVRTAEVGAYWRRLRARLEQSISRDDMETRPEPCAHCQFCEFRGVCEREWRDADSLVFVANLRSADRALFERGGVGTLPELARLDTAADTIDGSVPRAQESAVLQARLQLRSRERPDEPPSFEIIADSAESHGVGTAASASAGFALLPEPDEGDVFLDFEGHPFWRPDSELFFLFGLIEEDRNEASGWGYRSWWAHSRDDERAAVAALVAYLAERRIRYPGMHVYHYNHTERSALERLCGEHHVAEVDLDRLLQTGGFVDLYPVVLGAARVGAESYGLKQIERLTGFERQDGIERGAGAVVEYEAWMGDAEARRLERIEAYNEDDVRSTLAVRDWLVSQRPSSLAWRSPTFERPIADEDLDDRVVRLLAEPPGSPENVLGDLLGYWRREKRVVTSKVFAQGTSDLAAQLAAPGTIAGLSVESSEQAVRARTGNPLSWAIARLAYPEQVLSTDVGEGSRLVQVAHDGQWRFFDVVGVDHLQRIVEVKWPSDLSLEDCPSALVEYDWVPEGSKAEALVEIADRFLDRDPPTLPEAILLRHPAGFSGEGGPSGKRFSPDLGEILDWVPHLESSCVPIQGPPGTGKTFTGSHIVRRLVNAGKRVGVLAMSHHAIDNLVDAVVTRFDEAGELGHVRIARKVSAGEATGRNDAVTYTTSNERAADLDNHIVAGTAWFFAHSQMRANPVDVLVVDEAGQLGLADLLASSLAANAMVVLGDPQQLPHVSQASHSAAAGASALEHLLDGCPVVDEQDGVLLNTTWRMAPPLTDFISECFYEGRLGAHATCARQATAVGVGLRWIEAQHDGESTASEAEAVLIRSEILQLLGKTWTDRFGASQALTPDDIIVVAPYNHQRRCISELLSQHEATREVRVGTVDKFQGREAPVVFFSLTSSSQAEMPRGIDFLFSPNRLNVAISRARCLAYLVSTRRILDATASTVDEMRMLNPFAALAERAQVVGSSA